MNWFKKSEIDERKKYFLDRTKKHILLVQKNVKKVVEKFPEFVSAVERCRKHDYSKFKEPELTPYISLTWRKKNDDNFSQKKLLSKEEENKATLHHVLTNSHHPEYHLKNKEDANIDMDDRDKSNKCVDASLMPNIDIVEMVSDWQAVAEELKKNTAREWFDKQKDCRWHFSVEQEQLIDKLLRVFE